MPSSFDKFVLLLFLCLSVGSFGPVDLRSGELRADDPTASSPPLKFDETPREKSAREQMVKEYIAREGITHPGVLEAFRTVPRHLFVRDNLKRLAYFDQSLPIGHSQTITPPFVVAYMTQTLDPQPTDRVLEIGTGSGFQAAILSRMVHEVYSIEIVDELAKEATQRLNKLGFTNVHTKSGDGYLGWPDKAPFDKIIVTCSPEKVPQPLVDQLNDGGKLLIPLGERYQQTFYLFEKQNGELKQTKLIPTLFVPMTGASESERTVLPDPSNPGIINGGFEETQEVDQVLQPLGWHYLRQVHVLSAMPPEGKNFVRILNQDAGRFAQMLQAMPLDGRKIQAVRIDLWVRGENLKRGPSRYEVPAISLHLFDEQRKMLSASANHAWEGTFSWKADHVDVKIPPNAREAILYIGVNGGVGTLDVDGVTLKGIPR
ncbi:MAG: protein-L-isoaspartate(D-aspartate) O-methyltransferase [Planctomycetaceae bacterium]|nr:protein-L-isoaspartate(D-aspartate) O-methyltransferase [Planctomycetaceae bacterium]